MFLDYSADFDTVQHSVLLGKLKLYSVSEKSLRWFENYLTDRAQYVSIGGVPSEIRKIIDGTLQGSIGGPWCFLIMINDIVIIGREDGVTVYIYADDTALRVTLSGDLEEDQRKLNKLMKRVVKYMQVTKLKFNFKKTEFVVCSPRKHEDYSRLSFSLRLAWIAPKEAHFNLKLGPLRPFFPFMIVSFVSLNYFFSFSRLLRSCALRATAFSLLSRPVMCIVLASSLVGET